jgi:hypothetical protein
MPTLIEGLAPGGSGANGVAGEGIQVRCWSVGSDHWWELDANGEPGHGDEQTGGHRGTWD